MKIKLVHLLSLPESEREIRSVNSLAPLGTFFPYVQHVNAPATEMPAEAKAVRPDLQPPHWGCFAAFKRALETEFDNDLDFMAIAECDCLLECPAEEFYDQLTEVLKIAQAERLDYVSLGDKAVLGTGEMVSPMLQDYGLVYRTNKIIGCQFVVFSRQAKQALLKAYQTIPWNGTDLWLNQVCQTLSLKMGIVHKRLTVQADGFSLIGQHATAYERKKVVIITPHLSTGGMPQYIFWSVCELIQNWDVHLVEWECISAHYTIQRERVIHAVGNDHFHALNGQGENIFPLLDSIQPDVIYFAETPEHQNCPPIPYIPIPIVNRIYSYPCRFVETTHGAYMPVDKKYSLPDKFILVAEWNRKRYEHFGRPIDLIPYPFMSRPTREMALASLGLNPRQKHVLNVGLFNWNKRQGEIFEIAPLLPDVQFHFIGNQAPNFKGYWQPLMAKKPSNCHVWGERNDTERWYQACDLFLFPSGLELAPISVREAIAFGMPVMMRNLETNCGQFVESDRLKFMTDNVTENIALIKQLLNRPVAPTDFSRALADVKPCANHRTGYDPKPNVKVSFIGEPLVEINEGTGQNTVKFIDTRDGQVIHESTIGPYAWTKCYRRYYTPWQIVITGDANLDYRLDLKDQRVYVALDSKALGDTLAWMPYVEEFRKKHGCQMVCSTFLNQLFDYPDIEFVEPGTVVPNLLAMYTIGCYSDPYRNPRPWNEVTLQQIASDILGLEYREIRPRIKPVHYIPDKDRPGCKDYVCVGSISRGAKQGIVNAKQWNYPDGWKTVINTLEASGLDVYDLSLWTDLDKIIFYLSYCRYFIGLSSGLSWLAWALGRKVVMVSGFTAPWNEFQEECIRVRPLNGVCKSCWNEPGMKFDRGDQNWCPHKKGTPEQFICNRSITPQQVLEALP